MWGETPHAIFPLLGNSLVTTHQQNISGHNSHWYYGEKDRIMFFGFWCINCLPIWHAVFKLSLLVTAVQCQSSVNCIESELSSHFQNASTEGGRTPTTFSFILHGRATWGDCRQIIWGFNTLDITRTKKCLGGLGIGIICGEEDHMPWASETSKIALVNALQFSLSKLISHFLNN